MPVDLAAGGNTNASGSIAGMIQLRDGVAVTMQSQLDEIARGLITAFAETSPTNALPAAPGLFTWSGAPAMPAGRHAGQRPRRPDPPQPRDRFRAGRQSGAAARRRRQRRGLCPQHRTAASYADLLIAYGDRIDAPMAFDPATGIGASSSLSDYSTTAIGWFEGMRKEASNAAESKEALAVRTAEALSNETGVNVDMEMSLLLDLEHSYEASARLIKAVDEMLAALLDAVR